MIGELKFRFAKFEEFPKLIAMWRECFSQDERGAAHIFFELQRPQNILVGLVDGAPVAMLSIREFALTSPLKKHKAAYIYGVATTPENQGKGYCTALMENAGALLKRRQFVCSTLVPASEKLFSFYAKRGYEKAFNINKATIEASEIGDGKIVDLEPVSPERLSFIRDARFSDSKMFVRWDEQYLRYIISESELYGGGAFMFTYDGKQVGVICYRDGDTVYVKELAATLAVLDTAIRSVKAHFTDAERFVLYLREDVQTSYTNNLLPFGMIKWYDDSVKTEMGKGGGKPAYIAHVLD